MKQSYKILTNVADISKLLITLGLVVFLLVNIFGLVLSSSKQYHLNMLQCSNGQNGCTNVVQHVSNWQSVFTAIEFEDAFSLLLLFAGLALYFFKEKIFLYNWIETNNTDVRRFRKRFRNFLQLAFSQGILQPIL